MSIYNNLYKPSLSSCLHHFKNIHLISNNGLIWQWKHSVIFSWRESSTSESSKKNQSSTTNIAPRNSKDADETLADVDDDKVEDQPVKKTRGKNREYEEIHRF